MVHSAVGVDDGVLHEAAVLVDLLLGDLRFRGWVSRVAILAARRRRRAVLAVRRRRRGYSGVAAAAWRVVLSTFEISGRRRRVRLFFSQRRRSDFELDAGARDVGLIDGLRSGRESALLARERAQGQRTSSR